MAFILAIDGAFINSDHVVAIVPNNVTGGCDLVMEDARTTYRVTQTAEQVVKAIGRKA
jgi:hypothetical protein